MASTAGTRRYAAERQDVGGTDLFAPALVLLAQVASPSADDAWGAAFEGKAGIVAVRPLPFSPGVALLQPLDNCARFAPFSARTVAAFSLAIDAGAGRRTNLDVWIAELPEGIDAFERVESAGAKRFPRDFSCLLAKSGVSFIQVGRYWIELPTVCRKGYYRSAVAAVLTALRRARPHEFPAEFIYAPCGTMLTKTSPTAPFIKVGDRPSSRPSQRMAPRRPPSN